MDAHDLRRAIRQSWGLILLIVAISSGVAVVHTLRTESRYESDTQLFVAAAERESSIRRAPSYAGLVTSPSVTAPVVRILALADTPSELGERLSASAPPDTVLVDITVEDTDRVRAQRTARVVADRLIRLVEQLERPNATRASRVRMFVSSPASLPSDRVSPDARVNIVAGVVLGLLLGVFAALARRRLDRRISTPGDLPDEPGHGVLAAVPIDKTTGTVRPAGLRAAGPARAEALRGLRTNLRFLAPDQPPRTIVVASSLPGEGASTTAIGLAMAMAEAGSDVVLVEADLRRPWLTEHLSLRRNQGLAGHLVTGAPIEPLLQPCPGSHQNGALRVLVAGAVPPNPSELLSSPRMPELLENLRARCDVVLIDAPPVLSVTDAAVLAGEADGVLLVVRMRRLTRPDLERALSALARARASVLGFVANGVATTDVRDKHRAYPRRPEPATTPEPATPKRTTPEPTTTPEPATPKRTTPEPTTTPEPATPKRTTPEPTTTPKPTTPKPTTIPAPTTATPKPTKRPKPTTPSKPTAPKRTPPTPTPKATDGAASPSPTATHDS